MNPLLKPALVALVAAVGLVPGAYGHGPQLQVTLDGSTIVTREILTDDYAPLTGPKSAYVMPLLQRPFQSPADQTWYARPEQSETIPGLPDYYSGPGLAYGLDQTFDVGSVLEWGFADELLAWDGGEFVAAGAVDFESFTSSQTARASTGETIALAPIGPVGSDHGAYNDQSHVTIRHRLTVGGVTSVEPADGVYLATMRLTSDSSGGVASEAFYFVLSKDAPLGEVEAAVASLGLGASSVQWLVAPEPASAVLAALAALGLAAVGRRGAKA